MNHLGIVSNPCFEMICVPCRQARFKHGDVQHLFHSEGGLNILLEELGSLSDRLRFSRRDWDLVQTCLASMANVLGDPQHAINVQHLASEVLLNEIAAQDEKSCQGEKKHVGESRSSSEGEQNTIHLKPRPKCVVGESRSSSSRPSGIAHIGAKPKVRPTSSRKRPLPSLEQEEASELSVSPARDETPKEKPPLKKPCLSIGWCPQCHCMREKCFKPGDWACLYCGQHNYSDKETCSNKRCEQRRAPIDSWMVEELPTTACRAFTPWCKSCKKLKSECYKMNDWECPWCSNHNWARKQMCNHCGKMKPAEIQ